MTMHTHKALDAAAYLYLAELAGGLRQSGARHLAQTLTANVGYSDLMVTAIIAGTRAAAERIVQQTTTDADKRGFRLHGRVNDDRHGLDDHEHEVRFYMAVDPAA
jgi:hypothetical protein